jgi:hypothetical protein
MTMKVHAPSEELFWTAFVLLALSLFGHFVSDAAVLGQYHYWIAITSSVVLLIGCIV